MKKLLILAGVIALTCSTQVLAQDDCIPNKEMPHAIEIKKPEQPQCQKMTKPECHFKRFEEELQLTAKQKEQAKQLREKQMQAAKPLFEELKAKELEAQVLREKLRDLRWEGKKEFEAILTDKQLKKLQELKAERKMKFKKHHRGNFHKRPPMPPECKCDK